MRGTNAAIFQPATPPLSEHPALKQLGPPFRTLKDKKLWSRLLRYSYETRQGFADFERKAHRQLLKTDSAVMAATRDALHPAIIQPGLPKRRQPSRAAHILIAIIAITFIIPAVAMLFAIAIGYIASLF